MTTVPDLNWRYQQDPAGPRWQIKGTVLAVAFWPETNHRFLVEDVRSRVPHPTRVNDHIGGNVYRVRDANTVSDAETRHGIPSRVVFTSTDLTAVAAYIAAQTP